MKRTFILTIPLVACALVSCDFNQPLPNNGYNPLSYPGGNQSATTNPYSSLFTPGAFLQTVSPMTAFYYNYPKDMEQPNKTIPQNTDVKVISTKGTYIKVEVVHSGDVGYIPSVMLGSKRSPDEVPVTTDRRGYPVTPGITPAHGREEIQPPELGDPSRPAE